MRMPCGTCVVVEEEREDGGWIGGRGRLWAWMEGTGKDGGDEARMRAGPKTQCWVVCPCHSGRLCQLVGQDQEVYGSNGRVCGTATGVEWGCEVWPGRCVKVCAMPD